MTYSIIIYLYIIMNYKRSDKKNIIRDTQKNFNSNTKKIGKNDIKYDIDINKDSFISCYSGNKIMKKITVYNIEISSDERQLLENNINKENYIISLNEIFDIKASLLSYHFHKDNEKYVDLKIEIYSGEIFPHAWYKIFFLNISITINPCIIKINEYHQP